MIVASVTEPTAEAALAAMDEARRAGADIAELRVDFLEEPALDRILPKKPLPVMVTCRPAWEGGRWSGVEADRVLLLEEACALGADYVDVEFKAYKDIRRRDAKLVVSWHDFEKTPADLERIQRRIESLEPLVCKIAVAARSAADAIEVVKAQKRAGRPSALIAMGDFGEPLRILYRRYGGFLTYAAVKAGAEAAPGQLTVEALVKGYRAKAVDDETRVFAVIGDPVAQSRSPAVFNRVFQELGINARYVRLRLDDGARLRDAVAAWEVAGASVTVPHKEAALEAVDEADEIAREVGAVNTIVAKEGRLVGLNTDAPAARDAIREAAMRKWKHGVYGMRALVIGAGGTARAVAWGLLAEGARVVIANRTFEKAKTLGEELGCDFLPLSRVIEARAQVVCNATTVGMNADGSPYPKELWKADAVAFDAVYTPRETRFLREAKAAGAEVADGGTMFLKQADAQAKAFLGRGIPTEVRKELDRNL